MFFRFGSALLLVVLISLAGTSLEKEILELRRDAIRQHYRMDVLRDSYASLRLQTHQLGSPTRMIHSLESGELELRGPEIATQPDRRRIPLLRWRPSPTTSP